MTAKRKAKDATRPVMDENEWDFTQVRTDQLEACFCYEYGRQLTMQSPRLQEVLLMVNDHSALSITHRDPPNENIIRQRIHTELSRYFGAFPTIPSRFFANTCWGHLDVELRSRAAEEVKKDLQHYKRGRRYTPLTMKVLGDFESLNARSLRDLAFHHDFFSFEALDQTVYFGGAANLSHSDTEIIKAFGVWLKRAREEHEKRRCALMHRSLSRIMESGIQPPSLVRHRRKGRGGYRDKLRWLGALRVVRYYPPSQLVDYPDSNLKVDAPYSHLPDLHDAAKKAQSLLDEILRCDTSMLS